VPPRHYRLCAGPRGTADLMTTLPRRTKWRDSVPPCPSAGALQYWTNPPRCRVREMLDDGKRHQCHKGPGIVTSTLARAAGIGTKSSRREANPPQHAVGTPSAPPRPPPLLIEKIPAGYWKDRGGACPVYEWKECRDRAHENLECGRDDCPFIAAAGSLDGPAWPGYHWHVVSDGLLATPYRARCKPPERPKRRT